MKFMRTSEDRNVRGRRHTTCRGASLQEGLILASKSDRYARVPWRLDVVINRSLGADTGGLTLPFSHT
jgi:hypothetical protein